MVTDPQRAVAGPTMEFDYREGRYLFTDEFGHVWRLTPTGDESMPLIIELVAKAVANGR